MLAGASTLLASGALAEAAGKAVKVRAGSYKGTTSEHGPVTFKIEGRSIRHISMTVGYNGSCGPGGGPGFTIRAKPIAINRTGKFSAGVTLVGPVKAVKSQKGRLSGKARGGRVSGKLVDLTIANQKANTCKTAYNETFSATHT